MEQNISYWFGDTMVIILIVLTALAVFAAIAAFRKIKRNIFESIMYLTLSLFLGVVHFTWLANTPAESVLYYYHNLTFWNWLVLIFAPALIIVFVAFALYWYVKEGSRQALPRLFFGMTLIFFLFMVGESWPSPLKGSLCLLWLATLFTLERPLPPKKPVFVYQVKRLL